MAQRAKQPTGTGKYVQFPPEADEEFDVVPQGQITSWQDRLNERFGLGKGRLKVLEEPEAAN